MHSLVFQDFLFNPYWYVYFNRSLKGLISMWVLLKRLKLTGTYFFHNSQSMKTFFFRFEIWEVCCKLISKWKRYRKLLEAWREAKPPPKTAEEASKLIVQTLKRHQKVDVEVNCNKIFKHFQIAFSFVFSFFLFYFFMFP